ncbi:hypothetical protein BX285_1899 [Streptomyces sp. 1114.5]|uniref:hypothetical protein n=1 Tax=Streptomyces sp. 1114.5 TaxID=1938830 RepID=UPI000EAF13DF|nr:hypothetical protein [Streptomyces sp. 1114.5]RKT17522.1 hypothetical protein BX285_1899 [Streptomyces sp. 1114.5]
MGEFLGELATLFADGAFRRWHVARTRRRLAAGRPVRVPCSARSDRAGWQRAYVNGTLDITPGAATAAFGERGGDRLQLPTGGSFHEPEPDTWYDQDWAATCYLPPDGGEPVHLQVDSRYLPLVHVTLADPKSQQKV